MSLDFPGTHAVVSRFYDAALSNDLDAISAILHPDVVVYEAPSLPYGGTHAGRADTLALLTTLFSGIDLDTVILIDVLVKGNRAASFLEVPFAFADRVVPQRMRVIETFIVEDGLITEIRPFYFDTSAIASAMT
jgi:uncharacterized protein